MLNCFKIVWPEGSNSAEEVPSLKCFLCSSKDSLKILSVFYPIEKWNAIRLLEFISELEVENNNEVPNNNLPKFLLYFPHTLHLQLQKDLADNSLKCNYICHFLSFTAELDTKRQIAELCLGK